MPMHPAQAARGLVSVVLDEKNPVTGVTLANGAVLSGTVKFETLSELMVLPVIGEYYYKRGLSSDEKKALAEVIEDLREFHELGSNTEAYFTTPVFVDGKAETAGLDLVQDSADRSLWIALLASRAEDVASVKETLTGSGEGNRILNIGVAPAIELPSSFDDTSRPGRLPHSWAISTADLVEERPVYRDLRVLEGETTGEYTRRGVERLVMPGDVNDFGLLEGDPRKDANAGVGARPPRLDDPDRLARLVAWLRLSAADELESLPLSWVGVNAVEIDQRQTLRDRVIGQSDGSADQMMQLPVASVDPASFKLQVEESGRGYVEWQRIDDLALSGRDDSAYRLDSEAGTIRFGNGSYGRIPETGRRVRVKIMRAGGGKAGNLSAGTLQAIEAKGLDGNPVSRKLKVIQGIATDGGSDAETLDEAERRIPARLRHRNRAVTSKDYRALVAETPGVSPGRVEVLPRFMPRQKQFQVPGVVSVMVLPRKTLQEPPNPRPDQPMIRKVHDFLSVRRPLATELYVIGCEYVPVALSVGLKVRAGFGSEQVRHNVRQALQQYLWSLSPYGPQGEGWPLGGTLIDRELEVVVARTKGVGSVSGVNLFQRSVGIWRLVGRQRKCAEQREVKIELEPWQLPELLGVAVSTDGVTPETLAGTGLAGGGGTSGGDGIDGDAGDGGSGDEEAGGGVALPVVPEVC
jgi:predicted phage baseplate assembly protein